jgi:hypothetical protein
MILALTVAFALMQDDKADFLNAARKVGEAKSYTFRGETRLAMPESLIKDAGAEPIRFEGRVDRAVGATVKTDLHEFAMAGGRTAVRPTVEWRALKDDNGDLQRLLYQALAGARGFRLPHDEFGSWPKALASVKRTETVEKVGDKDGRVYEGEFTTESSRELLHALFPIGKWMDRIPIERPTGTARAWINGEGRLLKLELSAKVAASIQGQPVQLSATRTTTFSDVDSTKVTISDEAKKVLEPK